MTGHCGQNFQKDGLVFFVFLLFFWLLGFCCSCCLFCFNLVLFLHSNKPVKKKGGGGITQNKQKRKPQEEDYLAHISAVVLMSPECTHKCEVLTKNLTLELDNRICSAWCSLHACSNTCFSVKAFGWRRQTRKGIVVTVIWMSVIRCFAQGDMEIFCQK